MVDVLHSLLACSLCIKACSVCPQAQAHEAFEEMLAMVLATKLAQ